MVIVVTGRLADGRAARVGVERERIVFVEPFESAETASQPAAETAERPPEHSEAPLPWILPGMVDIQVNGYAGLDVNAEHLTTDVVHDLVRAQWAQGVTAFLPTLITAPPDHIVAALRVIAQARSEDSMTRHSVPGVHVEGPYLSRDDGPRGAHDPAHIRTPDLAELARWCDASEGAIRVITLAPEAPGALAYIRDAVSRGIVVAVGHTAASPDQIHAAADAGAQLCTHLGNGCHSVLPRHPNHIWAQLADTRLAASFVADGHHLPADTFVAMTRAKGASSAIIVSDSVTLAGCQPGSYTTPVGGAVTLHPDGRLTIAGSDLLAGAAASLSDCVAWAVRSAGLDLSSVAAMVSTNPARLLNLGGRGRIEPGASADLTVLSPDVASVHATMVRGRVVHWEDAGTYRPAVAAPTGEPGIPAVGHHSTRRAEHDS
jgi:N-acetylglucosamine-6-phosphate deacetylase